MFFLIGNILFYLGVLGVVDQGMHWGIYGGLYLIIGLILMMGRRIVPFFIELGVGYPVKRYNFRFLDLSSLFLFLLFFIFEMLEYGGYPLALTSLALFVLQAIRLVGGIQKEFGNALYFGVCIFPYGEFVLDFY